jgi:hypothetical protein
MKIPLEIFMLTKREQRVVIIIVMVLLAATIAKHYRDSKLHVPSSASTTAHGTVPSSPSPAEEERVPPDESP